mmetsp:Transcript_4764/g.15091  ORF Transcript_4764/g.15091 Transcript_4764/m.15091 type:complete len:208 (+) Transcript_4764:2185-2808(+)
MFTKRADVRELSASNGWVGLDVKVESKVARRCAFVGIPCRRPHKDALVDQLGIPDARVSGLHRLLHELVPGPRRGALEHMSHARRKLVTLAGWAGARRTALANGGQRSTRSPINLFVIRLVELVANHAARDPIDHRRSGTPERRTFTSSCGTCGSRIGWFLRGGSLGCLTLRSGTSQLRFASRSAACVLCCGSRGPAAATEGRARYW